MAEPAGGELVEEGAVGNRDVARRRVRHGDLGITQRLMRVAPGECGSITTDWTAGVLCNRSTVAVASVPVR
jgi:hypothetical protein